MADREDVTRPGQGEFDGVARYYDHLMKHVPYRGWVDYVQDLLKRWNAFPERVLDLACGTGKVGSEMLRRGYQVVGADLSEPMVRECGRQEPPLPAIVSDACCMGFAGGSFDLIVCLYDSLNYILDPEGFTAAMAEGYRVLRPGGLFIFDLNTVRALSTGMFTQKDMTSGDPLHYDWQAHWNPKTHVCQVDMWFGYQDDGGLHEFTETHFQRAYSHADVTGALKAGGFRKIKAYDGYRFTPQTPWSDRVFYVARKEI